MGFRSRLSLFAKMILACAVFLAAVPASAADLGQAVAALFEGQADIAVSPPQGEPPMGVVSQAGKPIAWYGNSYALMGSVGYSGKPIDVMVVVNPDATIRAAQLLTQDEPILTIGVSSDALSTYVSGFSGVDVRQPVRELLREGAVPDGVAGATISSGVIRDAILRSGRLLADRANAAGEGLVAAAAAAKPDWNALVAEGRVTLRTVTFAEARKAMPGAKTLPDGEGTFAEFALARLNDRTVADALIGAKRFDRIAPEFAADETILLVASRGAYSVKGTAWVKSGIFERLEIGTTGKTFNPTSERQHRLDQLHVDGAPAFKEVMLLGLPASAGIRSDAPVDVTLVVDKTDEGASAPARFPATLPPITNAAGSPVAQQATPPAGDADEPLWRENWREAAGDLALLTVMLMVLFGALYVSGPLVRRRELYYWFRTAFLLVTLVWLGWIAGAQLSVVQLIAFLQSLITGFNWQVFLLAPLIFVLWAFVALGVLFWGRGVYCGWLCPFGALQELLHQAGQRLGIKRIEVPWEVHERLWPLKYVALLVLIGLSLQDTGLAFRAAEVEPFKTAIILHFLRGWPFVLYAALLLGIGLFVERAYCRYLCPLGAALAIPSKFKIFDWLIRRPQCGRECRLCATTCTVQAIDPIGRINPNECIYCLKCQVNYHDAETCVPLKMRARRTAPGPVPAAEPHGN